MPDKVYEMIKKSTQNRGNVLRDEYLESVKKKEEHMNEHKKKYEKVLSYAKSTIKDMNDLKKFGLYFVKNRDEFKTEKDVDKYIKNNFKSDKKDTTKKDIEDLIKNIEKFLINTKII